MQPTEAPNPIEPIDGSSDFPQQDDKQDADMKEMLRIFGSSLSSKRDEWIRARQAAGVDRRMREDAEQYQSVDVATKVASSMMATVENGGFAAGMQPQNQPSRSTIFVGVTRQKTNAAEARLADIVLPTDDRNYSIDPTPNPVLAQALKNEKPMTGPNGQPMVGPNGQPMPLKDVAAAVQRAAYERAKAMEREIDDQLSECDYNGEVRKVIHDAAVFGTGVLKGPVVLNRVRKAWVRQDDATGTAFVMKMVGDLRPVSFRVDPRNVITDPACGDNVHNGSGIFERCIDTPKQVRKLAEQPGYDKEALTEVLDTNPRSSKEFSDTPREGNRDPASDEVYERWIYTGEIPHEACVAAGLCDDADTLSSYSAVVEFIGSTVIRMYLNPLEDGELPYDFFPWEKVVDSVWGYGIPFLMRAQQQVTNSTWRQMMDNAGVMAGPQVVVKPGQVQPANKKWELAGRKIWFATDETQDVTKAFTVIQVDARQDQLAKILELSERLSDQETAVPMLAQGAEHSAPETVGVSQMMMNSANVVLRRLVKQFDDYITKPHIQRYFNYNMAYSDKEETKGDFSVVARASAALMIRDIQNQAFQGLLQQATHPMFGMMIDAKKLFEKALRAQHVDPSDIMKSDEEIAAAQEAAAKNQKPDPRVEAAQVRAEADKARTEAQAKNSESEIALREQIASQNHAARIAELQLKRELAILELAQQQQLSIESIKASLADRVLSDQTKKDLFHAEAQIKSVQGSGI